MSTPTRRSERKRAVNTRIADLDSSPTQRTQPPSKKRKKVAAPAIPRPRPRQKTPVHQVAESEEESDDETAVDDDDTVKEAVELVVPHLTATDPPVVAAGKYPNHKTEELYGTGEISAFGKLCGKDWTFYVKTTEVIFGRAPDVRQSTGAGADATANDGDEVQPHIDLGPNKVVSRKHAELKFSSAENEWMVFVYGRNGVKVNEKSIKKGDKEMVKSGTVIAIAGTEMLFQAAGGEVEIHQQYLDRALSRPNSGGVEDDSGTRHGNANHDYPDPTQNWSTSSYPQVPGPYGDPSPANIARPVTPDTSPKRPAQDSTKKRDPGYKRGIMMESTDQIDYALDSSKDLKPGCSYASMITWAILSTADETLSLNGIYNWIKSHYAYYRCTNSGWQNSIRHNLSLNTWFHKVPRGADEPGKGMKWALVPEHREAAISAANKNASKGGGRVSSAPGSPLGGPHISSSFPQPIVNGNFKSSPTARTPPLSSYPPTQQESYTPTRGPQMPAYAPTQGGLPVLSDETSPLPRRRINGHLTAVDSSPTLTSGAWSHDQPMRTPAPRPHNLHVPQPNTVRLPTSHMADSSPAPFWRFENIGSTPARPWPELSPLKNGIIGEPANLESSSPPPAANGVESPTRKSSRPGSSFAGRTGNISDDGEDEDGAIDITRGFKTISKFHEQRSNVAAAAGAISS